MVQEPLEVTMLQHMQRVYVKELDVFGHFQMPTNTILCEHPMLGHLYRVVPSSILYPAGPEDIPNKEFLARTRIHHYRSDADVAARLKDAAPSPIADELSQVDDEKGIDAFEDTTTMDVVSFIQQFCATLGFEDMEHHTLEEVLERARFLVARDRLADYVKDNTIPDADATLANQRQVGGAHYGLKGFQHWDMVALFKLDYFQGQITKYVMRWKNKNGLQDLQKAQHFLEKYIELENAKIITEIEPS